MKFLTLIRHAKSSWKETEGSDFERPLNRRGLRDAPEMARRFARNAQPPDLLLSSPAERAATTTRTLAEALGREQSQIAWDSALYLASPGQLLDAVQGLDEGLGHAALVGHNPGLTDLAELLGRAGISNIPTCGIVRLELDVESWLSAAPGCARLLDFDYPKRKS